MEMKGTPYTPIWYGIHTVSHDLPMLSLDVADIMFNVFAIILWHKYLIHLHHARQRS